MLPFVFLVVPAHLHVEQLEAGLKHSLVEWPEWFRWVGYVEQVSHSFPQYITWNSGRRS